MSRCPERDTGCDLNFQRLLQLLEEELNYKGQEWKQTSSMVLEQLLPFAFQDPDLRSWLCSSVFLSAREKNV